VIVDVEATRAIRQAEVGAARTTLERTETRFGIKPAFLTADSAHGSADSLAWLVKEKDIAPHIPVFDKSNRPTARSPAPTSPSTPNATVTLAPRAKSLSNSDAPTPFPEAASRPRGQGSIAPANWIATPANSKPSAVRTLLPARSRGSNFINHSFYSTTDENNVNFRLGSPGAQIVPVNLTDTLHLSTGDITVLDIALVGAAAYGPEAVAAVSLAALGAQALSAGAFGYQPQLPVSAPLQTPGQINTKDLNQNQFSVLMNMGLLLDIAHMGQKTAATALKLALKYDYPLMDSHTGVRCDSPFATDCSTPYGFIPSPANVPPGVVVNERSLPTSQVRIIKQLGGVIGLGMVPAQSDPDPVTT
jgi:hypothetical protein